MNKISEQNQKDGKVKKINQNGCQREINAKILIVGDQAVGKSSILRQYTEEIFDLNQAQTTGMDFKPKDLIINNTKLKLKIWDTAGQEKYRTITNNFYRGTDGVILVFDMNLEKSIDSVPHWIRQINLHAGGNIPKILVGNKCDLEVRVSPEKIDEICNEHQMEFFKVSAKTNLNIAESFNAVANQIISYGIMNDGPVKENGFVVKVKTNNKNDENSDFSGNCKC